MPAGFAHDDDFIGFKKSEEGEGGNKGGRSTSARGMTDDALRASEQRASESPPPLQTQGVLKGGPQSDSIFDVTEGDAV